MISLFVFGGMFALPFIATFIAVVTGQWWLLWSWAIWGLAIIDDLVTIRSRK